MSRDVLSLMRKTWRASPPRLHPLYRLARHSPPYSALCFRIEAGTTTPSTGATQCRSFLKPSMLTGAFATTTPLRHLNHTRTISYPRSSVFDAIVSVERYPTFLPFVLSATVSGRDQNQYPTRASVKVGYSAFKIEENWDSIIRAEEGDGLIEAHSADTDNGDTNSIFEFLKAKWKLKDVGDKDRSRPDAGEGAQTAVRLDLEVKFRSAIYDTLFAEVEGKVAGMMVSAFEERMRRLTKI